MNSKQKIIIAIIIPIILFFIGIGINEEILYNDWYALYDSWFVWTIISMVIGIFEYKVFRD